jgi:hypothetical protein
MIVPQNTHAYDYGTGIVEIAEEERKRLPAQPAVHLALDSCRPTRA